MALTRRLLWIDCGAGALGGVLVLILHPWLIDLYGLPRGVVLSIGAANLCYAAYSFGLAVRPRRPLAAIGVLAAANGAWALVCLVLAAAFATSATMFGLAHLVVEALFVGGLAWVEWQRRHALAG